MREFVSGLGSTIEHCQPPYAPNLDQDRRNPPGNCLRLALLFLVASPFALRGQTSETVPGSNRDLQRTKLIKRIDELISAQWNQAGIRPAGASRDGEFLRRASLDLTGVIPRVSEIREFLNDRRPDKRSRAIDRLLASPRHVTHLANTWRNILLPGGVGGEQLNNVIGVQRWLRGQFAQNMRYDRMVADLLVARGGGQDGPALFFTANDLAPEKIAAATARIFLGIQVECAQCHDHPFDHWKQQDFWGYAAFFARLQQSSSGRIGVQLVDADSGEVKLPDTDTVVAPKYPGGAPARIGEGGNRRVQLAIWMASRDNPYLARAAVNRIWSHMFGYGIVEPVDDIGKHNQPSHPQLFDELAEYFVDTGFDIRELYRAIANTNAYQRSSQVTHQNGEPPGTYARMSVRALNPEQFYDSLARVLSPNRNAQNAVAGGGFDARRQAFIARIGQPRRATDYESGVPQALTMMNGIDMTEATTAAKGSLLAALDSPFFKRDDKIQILFLATLSRPANAEQLSASRRAIERAKDEREGLGDVLWALLNSVEFAMNH